MLSPLRI
jgi:hypothetical protein